VIVSTSNLVEIIVDRYLFLIVYIVLQVYYISTSYGVQNILSRWSDRPR